MPPSDITHSNIRELVYRLEDGNCVLVLGPCASVSEGGAKRTTLNESLAYQLSDELELVENEPSANLLNELGLSGEDIEQIRCHLPRIAELYYRKYHDRYKLEGRAQDFYAKEGVVPIAFHRDLAQLPFRLCLNASPDNMMYRAFELANKQPQRAHYNRRRKDASTRIDVPSEKSPLIYHLYGYYEDAKSMVLTEGDLIDFLVAIVKEEPPLPDAVRSILRADETSFLFIGFGFQNWYLRVLLKVLNVYGKHNRQIAFEDPKFFQLPDYRQTVGFFSGDRDIAFQELRLDQFAKQLREAYIANQQPSVQAQVARALPSDAPRAFLSYASEDRESVELLALKLKSKGVDIWLDKQNLRGGDEWKTVLVDVISKKVNYVVVVQTEAMLNQSEGYYNLEIKAALERQDMQSETEDGLPLRFIVPITLGDCHGFAKLDKFHHINVNNIDDETGFDMLAKTILEDWAKRPEHKTAQKRGGETA